MEKLKEILNFQISFSEDIFLTVKSLLIVLLAIILSGWILNILRRILTRKLPKEDKLKFVTVFSFLKWFVYLLILLLTLQASGVKLTAVFAASAALLIGIGLALQTFFQDIISGIFILVDQSVHVGDIIEINDKVGRVEVINLRTTRAVTIDNKTLIIPNHLYLTNTLFNWTQNGTITRESINVGVAYGSDVELVKKLLTQAANEHPKVLKFPPPLVLFTDFGDSSLDFRLVVTLDNSFEAIIPKSELRFKVNQLFAENDVTIPFPQRDVHLYTKPE